MQGMTSAQKIEFKDAPKINQDNYEYPILYGWQFSNDRNKQAIVINLSSREINIDISNFAEQQNYEQLFAEPKTLVNNPQAINKLNREGNNMITLFPYSVTRID